MKAFARLGFVFVRQRGSHVTLHHPIRNREVTIPLHPAISVGTLAAILRRAEVDIEEFLAAL